MAFRDSRAKRLGSIPVNEPPVEADIGARRVTQAAGRDFPYPASRRGGGPGPVRVHPGGSVGTTKSNPATPHGNG